MSPFGFQPKHQPESTSKAEPESNTSTGTKDGVEALMTLSETIGGKSTTEVILVKDQDNSLIFYSRKEGKGTKHAKDIGTLRAWMSPLPATDMGYKWCTTHTRHFG
ncbi:hypothetical protein TIFTF001_008627 [Ficus carica]|uniref:Uncharacterized protein n=1 Tax=Ficus carica TaxID=3494 RepID=A0AA87ZSI5_FICCA|nr:hypothetical protein TIFTF001_008627 [Ficus carica]